MANIFTKEEIMTSEPINFDNSQRVDFFDEEAHEMTIEFNQITTWDSPFKIILDGQLVWVGKTFASFVKNTSKLINNYNLSRVKE